MVLVFSCCAVTGTGRRALVSNLCTLLGVASLAALVMMIAEWPTPHLAQLTTRAGFEWEWEQADAAGRAAVEDALGCCGYSGLNDR